jgi:Uma2 family endonuclease
MPAETPLHRLSVEDVYRMVEAGVLREEDRVELVDGVLVDMTPPSAEHSAAVAWLTQRLVGSVGEREVRVQDLLLVEGGFFMPDLIVVDPLPRDRHPSTAALVVEVAVTTQRHDTWKANRYAGAGVDEYWIVDLVGRVLTVHRGPRDASYRNITLHRSGDRIRALVSGAEIDVAELLGA